MSEKALKYNYITLDDFIRSRYTQPRSFHIIPVFRTLDKNDVYGMLTYNENLTVTSFGGVMPDRKTILTYITDNIYRHSLGVINFSEYDVLRNSMVAFTTEYSTYRGEYDIVNEHAVIIFVEMDVESVSVLNSMLELFKSRFCTVNSADKIKPTNTNRTAMFYMDASSMFYLFRFTTWKTINHRTGETVRMSVQDDGFPAYDDITKIYKAKYSSGEVPITDFPNEQANTCPEIEFYTKIDNSLGNSYVRYIIGNLPIM